MSDPVYLLVPEAAEMARVSIGTIRHWLLIGRLKACRPGRRVLIRRDALVSLIEGSEAR